jgi:hypothetical protein
VDCVTVRTINDPIVSLIALAKEHRRGVRVSHISTSPVQERGDICVYFSISLTRKLQLQNPSITVEADKKTYYLTLNIQNGLSFSQKTTNIH